MSVLTCKVCSVASHITCHLVRLRLCVCVGHNNTYIEWMWLSLYVYVFISLSLCLSFCLYVFVCLPVNVSSSNRPSVSLSVVCRAQWSPLHVCVYVSLPVPLCIFVCICVPVCVSTCLCFYTYVWPCLCMYVYLSVCLSGHDDLTLSETDSVPYFNELSGVHTRTEAAGMISLSVARGMDWKTSKGLVAVLISRRWDLDAWTWIFSLSAIQTNTYDLNPTYTVWTNFTW